MLKEIILDFGSGNTCHSNLGYVKTMIDKLAEVDPHTVGHRITIKWQLATNNPPNEPLDRSAFVYAYEYAAEKGYRTTSSVFDRESLEFLLQFDIPFVKIPCIQDLYPLIGFVPRHIPVYVSVPDEDTTPMYCDPRIKSLCCVRKYPADEEDYLSIFPYDMLESGISDHTQGLRMYDELDPYRWEKHYVIERNPNNPDSGLFAATPEELKEVL